MFSIGCWMIRSNVSGMEWISLNRTAPWGNHCPCRLFLDICSGHRGEWLSFGCAAEKWPDQVQHHKPLHSKPGGGGLMLHTTMCSISSYYIHLGWMVIRGIPLQSCTLLHLSVHVCQQFYIGCRLSWQVKKKSILIIAQNDSLAVLPIQLLYLQKTWPSVSHICFTAPLLSVPVSLFSWSLLFESSQCMVIKDGFYQLINKPSVWTIKCTTPSHLLLFSHSLIHIFLFRLLHLFLKCPFSSFYCFSSSASPQRLYFTKNTFSNQVPLCSFDYLQKVFLEYGLLGNIL